MNGGRRTWSRSWWGLKGAGRLRASVVLGAAVMLLLEGPDSASDSPVPAQRFGGNGFAKAAFFALVLLAARNAVSTFLQCGLGVCADSPTHYELLGS